MHSRYSADEEHRRKINATADGPPSKRPACTALASAPFPPGSIPARYPPSDKEEVDAVAGKPVAMRGASSEQAFAGIGRASSGSITRTNDAPLEMPWESSPDDNAAYFYGAPGGFATPRAAAASTASGLGRTEGSWRDIVMSECVSHLACETD